MSRKKIKVTIESEGNKPQVLEAYGIAAALLTEGDSEETYGITIAICGGMGAQDLMHLYKGVTQELTQTVESTLLDNMSTGDLRKALIEALLEGDKHESDR